MVFIFTSSQKPSVNGKGKFWLPLVTIQGLTEAIFRQLKKILDSSTPSLELKVVIKLYYSIQREAEDS